MVGMVLGSCLWGGEECLQDSSLFCTHMFPWQCLASLQC